MNDWPAKLSKTGLFVFTDQHKPLIKPAKQLIAYEVNAPFWSDNAEKSRYFVLPEGESSGYRAEGNWGVPVGSTIVKNFNMQMVKRSRIFETRLIKRTKDGWESATYVWDKKGTDAELLADGKQFQFNAWGVKSWHAPSSSECASCHVDAAGYGLGLSTAQLNRQLPDGKLNQIEQWAQQGIVDLPANVNLKSANRFCSLYDQNADLETRARVWLDVNCAMCHQPNGPGNANNDLRYATSMENTKTIGIRPTQGDLGIEDAKLIAPGYPKKSLMVHRIETLSDGRMPSLGSNQVDTRAVALLSEWIRSMR